MKVRNGFVSNSSSSSFICITAGKEMIYGDDSEPNFEIDYATFDIDNLILMLQAAKDKGAKTVEIAYGGGYDG